MTDWFTLILRTPCPEAVGLRPDFTWNYVFPFLLSLFYPAFLTLRPVPCDTPSFAGDTSRESPSHALFLGTPAKVIIFLGFFTLSFTSSHPYHIALPPGSHLITHLLIMLINWSRKSSLMTLGFGAEPTNSILQNAPQLVQPVGLRHEGCPAFPKIV